MFFVSAQTGENLLQGFDANKEIRRKREGEPKGWTKEKEKEKGKKKKKKKRKRKRSG